MPRQRENLPPSPPLASDSKWANTNISASSKPVDKSINNPPILERPGRVFDITVYCLDAFIAVHSPTQSRKLWYQNTEF